MTDKEIAREVRALASDRRNPMSVTCVVCKVTAGDPCVPDKHGTPPTDNGFHQLRVQDARLTADGAATRLLVSLAKEIP